MNHEISTFDTRDDLLTLLADRRCRDVLFHFRDASTDVASVTDLADEVSKQDHGGTEAAAVELHHATLPRLADAGVVEYDARSNTVRYRGHPELGALLDGVGGR